MADWEEEEDESKPTNWQEFILKYGIYIGLVVFWIAFHTRMGTYSIQKTDFIVTILGLGFFAFKNAWDSMKNSTPKFVFNDGWTEIDPGRVPIQLGNYAMVMPSIKSWNMFWHFKHPVYIAPIDAIRNKGRNLVANVRMEQATIEQLPLTVRGFIIENNLKPPYFMGLADVDQYEEILKDPESASKMDKPSVSYLIQYAKECNQLITMLTSQLFEAYNVSEETIANKMRILERMRPSEVPRMIKSLFFDQEKEKRE